MALNRMATATVAVAVTLAPLAGAPVASAGPNDVFLDELATLNVYIPEANAAATVAAGNQVCNELRGGTSVLDEMSRAEEIFRLPSGQGTLFVSAATTNLCPDFAAG